MVNKLMYFALCLVLLISACSRGRMAGRDSIQADSKQRSAELFAELDDTKTDAPLVSQSPKIQATSEPAMPVPKMDEAIVVEIDTFKVFNDQVSLKDAENQVRSFVRELALEHALPADVSLTSLSTTMYVERNARFDESAAKGIFLMSSSAGRFLSEEFLKREPSFDTKSHSMKYRMHYRAKILPVEKVYNPSMNLQVKLSETLLRHGDLFDISVTPNMDGYLYVFNFLNDNSVALCYPTRILSENSMKSGQKWQEKGQAECDPKKDFVIETLYFVFSLDPIAGWEEFASNVSANELVYTAGEQSFILFQNWLAKSDPRRRIEKMVQLHIYK